MPGLDRRDSPTTMFVCGWASFVGNSVRQRTTTYADATRAHCKSGFRQTFVSWRSCPNRYRDPSVHEKTEKKSNRCVAPKVIDSRMTIQIRRKRRRTAQNRTRALVGKTSCSGVCAWFRMRLKPSCYIFLLVGGFVGIWWRG